MWQLWEALRMGINIQHLMGSYKARHDGPAKEGTARLSSHPKHYQHHLTVFTSTGIFYLSHYPQKPIVTWYCTAAEGNCNNYHIAGHPRCEWLGFTLGLWFVCHSLFIVFDLLFLFFSTYEVFSSKTFKSMHGLHFTNNNSLHKIHIWQYKQFNFL